MTWEGFREFLQQPEVPGVAGAVLSLRWMPGDSSWVSKLTSLSTGMGVAIWLAPWVAESMEMKSKSAIGALCFLGGLFGLLLVSRVWDYLSTTPVGEWIGSLLPKRPQQ